MDFESSAAAIINSQFWKLALIFITSIILANVLNSIATMIISYLKFLTDETGIGSEVTYQKKNWKVTGVGFRRIKLDNLDEPYSILVHTAEWKNMHILIRKDNKA